MQHLAFPRCDLTSPHFSKALSFFCTGDFLGFAAVITVVGIYQIILTYSQTWNFPKQKLIYEIRKLVDKIYSSFLPQNQNSGVCTLQVLKCPKRNRVSFSHNACPLRNTLWVCFPSFDSLFQSSLILFMGISSQNKQFAYKHLSKTYLLGRAQPKSRENGHRQQLLRLGLWIWVFQMSVKRTPEKWEGDSPRLVPVSKVSLEVIN